MIEAPHTYHSLYLALRTVYKDEPNIWTVSRCALVMTSIMSAQPFAWRVVGITECALKKLHESNYKIQSGSKITRAHIKPRIEMVNDLFVCPKPPAESEFIKFWLDHDRTVLCGKGENKTQVPEYIQFSNPEGALFANQRVGWRHGKLEREFLANLHATQGAAPTAR